MTSSDGQVALVTGATRGIGRATAIALAKAGHDVAINYVSAGKDEEAEKLASRLGGIAIRADVSDSQQVDAMVERVEQELGAISVLVNNAGITRDGLVMRMSDEDFSAVIDINMKGTFLCSRAVTRGMMKARHGSIINLSSVVGRRGNAGQANYAASKAGIVGFTKSLARELGPRGVRVNVVAPGYVETDMTARLDDKAKEDVAKMTPLRRLATPEEVANVVAFLASPEASYITGAVIPVDGGLGI